MAAPCDPFSSWLSEKLNELSEDIDVETFVEYITGILQEEDASRDDKIESLSSFLTEVVPESDARFVSENIIDQFEAQSEKKDGQHSQQKVGSSLDEQLSRLMENQKLNLPVRQTRNKETVVNRDAILAQYGEVSSGDEEEDSPDECAGANSGANSLVRNVNASTVDDKQREMREKMKQQHEEKKERDRLDREKQKQVKQEKADKAKQKTQKQERRR